MSIAVAEACRGGVQLQCCAVGIASGMCRSPEATQVRGHSIGQHTWVSGLHRVPVCSAPPQRGQKRALQPAPGQAICFTPTCMYTG